MQLSSTYQLTSHARQPGRCCRAWCRCDFQCLLRSGECAGSMNHGLAPPSGHAVVQQFVELQAIYPDVLPATFLFVHTVVAPAPPRELKTLFPIRFSHVLAPVTRPPLPTSIHFIATCKPFNSVAPKPTEWSVVSPPFCAHMNRHLARLHSCYNLLIEFQHLA